MKKIIISFLILLCTDSVFAAEWVQIGYKTYADITSYKKEGIYASAWFKDLNPGNWETMNGKKVWYHLYLFKANCPNKTIFMASSASYDLKGELINSGNYPDIKSYYDPVVPDSVGELKYNALCR